MGTTSSSGVTANFSGVGSGIDFSTITTALVAAQSGPLNQLTAQQSTLQNQQSSLQQLNTLLATLHSASSALTDQTLGTGLIGSSSNTNVLTATSGTGATAGAANVQVSRLATTLAQASGTFSSPQASILNGGATSATFQLLQGSATTGPTITINSSNNSLSGLESAINSSGAAISASIVDVSGNGTQYQLVLDSTGTGAAGAVQLQETTSTGTGAALNLRALNPPDGTLSELDAQFSINGLSITRPTNTVSDAIPGVTLGLQSTGSSSVSVGPNTSTIQSALSSFVNAYNGVEDFINSQYQLDSNNKPSGILATDPTLRLAQEGLRDILSASSGGSGSLLSLGITRSSTGDLTLDSTALSSQLKNSLGAVQATLSGLGTSSTGLGAQLANISSGLSGDVQSAITGYTSSIKQVNQSISRQQAMLNALTASLTAEFSAADAAIGQLNSQNATLTSILNSLSGTGATSSSSASKA